MVDFRDRPEEEMPAHLAAFRLADWIDPAQLDGVSDAWEARHCYDRPVDPVAREAFERFTAARTEWERANPAWVEQEVADHIARRLERAARWTRQEDNRDDTNRGA